MKYNKSLTLKKTVSKLHFVIIIAIFLLLFVYFFRSSVLIFWLSLFIFCLVFMFRFGQFIFLDVDPVPFSAILILSLYGYMASLYFIIIAIPMIDILSSRFNHYSFINFISIFFTALLFGFFPLPGLALFVGIIVFNLLRIIIGKLLGQGINFTAFCIVHAAIYFVIGSTISYFLF